MRRIAVYGKGGIGKSTISSNLSAALSAAGHTVLQIGCDPKHDSTRLLLHGKRLTCVLDYMRTTKPLDYRMSDILDVGYQGVGCVEAGGPKPGVGCAGRGIISTFELLDQFKLDEHYDTTIYDVLGDVVCGGFAVPIRSEYADTILIVTSGEFMALYAANNILRGIQNYDSDRYRIAGLVYNQRNVEGEDERVQAFAQAVQLPIFATVPRDNTFARAERANMTAMELADSPEVCAVFTKMAQDLQACKTYPAQPLTDEQLEQTIFNATMSKASVSSAAAGSHTAPASSEASNSSATSKFSVASDFKGDLASSATSDSPKASVSSATPHEERPDTSSYASANASNEIERKSPNEVDLADPNRYLSKNMVNAEPLHGCAFNGALCTAAQLRDAVLLAHSPKSCAYISLQTITSTGRRVLFERGSLLPASLLPNLECTEMGEPEIVFGGMEKLEAKVKELKASRPPAIVVVSSCPAGIIGDNIDEVAALSEPDLPVIPLKANGNMSGDYQQGMFFTYTALARALVQRDVPVVPRTVNIIGEKMVITNAEENFSLIESYLRRMGVSVTCRFLYNTTVEALKNLCSAELTLRAYTDYTTDVISKLLKNEFGLEIFERGFPVGYDETAEWLRLLAARFNCPEVAEEIIAEETDAYKTSIAALQPALEGKRLMIITYNSELDWILKPALEAGMEVVKIGLLDYSQDEGFRTRLDVELPVEEHYDRVDRAASIEEHKPDVLLTNYASSLGNRVRVADTIPMCPDVGFDAGVKLVQRWVRLAQLNLNGEWRQDEQLLTKYDA